MSKGVRNKGVRKIATAVLGAAVAVGSVAGGAQLPVPSHPAVMPLRDYQHRWVNDHSRFKIAVKSARIGFSFATALEAVLDCIAHPKATWTVLSASKPQSVEFIQTCHNLLELIHGTVELFEDEDFYDELGKYEAIQQRVTLPNGARIIALAANPRTARGYPGNAILDEFGHHEESAAIWAAITRQVSLGHKVRVLSTPNGEQGKFYDLCLELGLTDGVEPEHNFQMHKGWSVHWISADMAIVDGCPINMGEMRQLIQDDDIVNQEFYCIFLKAAGAWLSLDLIQKSEDPGATIDWPGQTVPITRALLGKYAVDPLGVMAYRPRGLLFGGIDVGRIKDRTTFWIKELVGDVLWTRMVIALHGVTFPDQARTLGPYVRLTTRTAIDSTGMGIALFDLLNEEAPGRVMGVNFAGSSRLRNEKRDKAKTSTSVEDGAVSMKTDLAIKIIRTLTPVTKTVFDGLTKQYQADAFTVAGVTDQRVLQRIRDELADELAKGGTSADFQRAVDALTTSEGTARLAAPDLDNVFQNMTHKAYSAGRYEQMTDDSVLEALPYWQFWTVGDDRVRPEHEVLHRFCALGIDPVWRKIYPPCGYGCRCSVVPLSAAEAPAGSDEGGLERLPLLAILKVPQPGYQGVLYPLAA